MAEFTIIDGDFQKKTYPVHQTSITLEDISGHSKTYYLDNDLQPIKLKAVMRKETIFTVILKDGKSFSAKADALSFKDFMARAGQPLPNITAGIVVMLILLVVAVFAIKSWIGGDDLKQNNAIHKDRTQIGQPLIAPDIEYFAILRSEIANIDSTNINDVVKDGPGVLAGLDRVRTWARLYDEHKKYNVTDEENLKLIRTFKDKVSAHQKKLFPKLREIHCKVMKGNAWEHDIDVQVYGNGGRMLKFTGNTFVRNANIKAFMDTTYAEIEPLRYKRISFRWNKYSGEETFYDLTPHEDGELVK